MPVRTSGTTLYRHPAVGFPALQLPEEPDQTLFAGTAKSGSPSQLALKLLASRNAVAVASSDGRHS